MQQLQQSQTNNGTKFINSIQYREYGLERGQKKCEYYI